VDSRPISTSHPSVHQRGRLLSNFFLGAGGKGALFWIWGFSCFVGVAWRAAEVGLYPVLLGVCCCGGRNSQLTCLSM
jgi:hypothetical protein